MYYSEKQYSSLGKTCRIMFNTCHVKTNNELKKIHGKTVFVGSYEGAVCLQSHIGVPTLPRKNGYSFKVGKNSEANFPEELIGDVFGNIPKERTIVRVRVFTEGDFVYIVEDPKSAGTLSISKPYIAPQKQKRLDSVNIVDGILNDPVDNSECLVEPATSESQKDIDKLHAKLRHQLLLSMPLAERAKYLFGDE